MDKRVRELILLVRKLLWHVLNGAELLIELAGQTDMAKGNKRGCWRENAKGCVSQIPQCHRFHRGSGLEIHPLSASCKPFGREGVNVLAVHAGGTSVISSVCDGGASL